MNAVLNCWLEGWALWSPMLPGWSVAEPALRSIQPTVNQALMAQRPAPTLLAANERRRAPDSVLVALEVASQALLAAGLTVAEASDLASIFVSAHGDLPTTDALCTSLATDPLLLSPTRFHHSVHNAASGYWAIASRSQGPSTALAALEHSFAAGWLEAASLCAAEQRRVLLVAYDTAACGGLASVNSSRGLLGVALLLAPRPGAQAKWALSTRLSPCAAAPLTLRSAAARALEDNAMSGALPLFEALAWKQPTTLQLPVAAAQCLELQLVAAQA